MSKIQVDDVMGIKNLLFPQLPVLVGANVDGKANYITIALVGWLCYDTISISVGHKQYSLPGIQQNMTFSVNQPSTALLRELDYCGMASGRKVDKGALFDTFYGALETAPLIRQCPVNIECRVIQILRRPLHTVFIGEVAAIHLDKAILRENAIDVTKLDPILYAPGKRDGKFFGGYWKMGEFLGRAWHVGKELETERPIE